MDASKELALFYDMVSDNILSYFRYTSNAII